jgi:transposase
MTEIPEEPRLWRDPIVAEVRRIREELFAAAGYDIQEFCRRLREKQAQSGHRVITREPRAIPGTPGEAA